MADTTASEGTALATTGGVGQVPAVIQTALDLQKQRNKVAGVLAGMNWGKEVDQQTRLAVAMWGQTYGVDVSTEINVLGGNIYKNSAYYLRRLSEMVEAGLVEYAVADHIEADPRLLAMMADDSLPAETRQSARAENTRRTFERVRYQVPDKAVSAVAFRVKLRTMGEEVVGVKWCGGGTRQRDPVGDQFPVETSESRAARRCLKQIAQHNASMAAVFEAGDEEAVRLGERIASERDQTMQQLRSSIEAHPRGINMEGRDYGGEDLGVSPPRALPQRSPAAAPSEPVAQEDPYEADRAFDRELASREDA